MYLYNIFLKNQFFHNPNIIFFNHGSFGSCPKPIYNDLLYWQNKLEQDPVYFFEELIFNKLEKSREALGSYINCSPGDVVFFTNPTTAINAVARSLKLNIGDEVLSTNHIYGALDNTWSYICKKNNASLVKAPIPFSLKNEQQFLDLFFKHITKKTKVIFISHITSMTAMIFPIKEIINYAKEKKILTIIDGAHVPGHVSLDIKKLDPDIYTGACHKWMCAPKGTSFLYVKKELQKSIHPLIVSWGWESENPRISKFLDWHQWQGTNDMSSFLTIPKTIKFLNDNNWQKHSKLCHEHTIRIRNNLLDFLNISHPCPDNWIGQMASIPIPIENPEEMKNILFNKFKIQVPVFKWNDMTILRYSIQVYNNESEMEILLKSIKEILC